MEFVTHLQYEYAQVAVDLFYENLTPVHCSVAVCIHVSPFYLYLKEYVIIRNLDPQCRAAWQERQGLQRTKPLLNVYAHWTA